MLPQSATTTNSEINTIPHKQNINNQHSTQISLFSLPSTSSNNQIELSKRNNSSRLHTNVYNSLTNSPKHLCRICFESDIENNLIVPCKCEGSIKYVHRKCIEQWIISIKVPIDKAKCEICKTKFKIKHIKPSHLTKKQLHKLIFASTLFILLFIALLSIAVYGLYCVLLLNGHIHSKRNKKIFLITVGIIVPIIIIIVSFIFIWFYKNRLISNLEQTWEIENLQKTENDNNKESDVKCITMVRRDKKIRTSSEIIDDIILNTKFRMKKNLQ